MATTETTLTTDAWADLGSTPCALQLRSGSVRFVVASSAPTNINADHFTLTEKEGSADIGVTGQNVYARSGEARGIDSRVAVIR
ncbi:hypothetical protein [Bosea sp. (in: a-proteobacteria)]|uniref:hypothetical protein n=1 Tax=Bosea sp. (in: a-proteobacteria) TaxID=1871050 RepID=UPI0026390944|nr:hypothetical protein [Bosea sp. (in: a-proteobacteria)]MCO5092654.1 hypothetical protein [Bosea sp. (in: a-proteobacteria)]